MKTARIPLEVAHDNNRSFDYGMIVAFEVDAVSQLVATLAVLASSQHSGTVNYAVTALVVDALVEAFEAALPPYEWLGLFKSGFQEAADRILRLPDEDNKNFEVSCSAVLVVGNKLFFASYGDCRIFLLREDEVKHISVPHTWIEKLLETGHLTSSDASDVIFDGSSVVSSIGKSYPLSDNFPDLRIRLGGGIYLPQSAEGINLNPSDQILVCSRFAFESNRNLNPDGLKILRASFPISEKLQHVTASFGEMVLQKSLPREKFSVIALRVPPK